MVAVVLGEAQGIVTLTAPFPYFGGKRRAAQMVWERLGDVPNYIEPFCGSCAVLLGRPSPPRIETVNDVDGLLVNFWRAVAAEPDRVAHHANWPVTELDLHARHDWLLGKRVSISENLRSDPSWFDARAAGWWCWGANAWIGTGWGEAAAKQIVHLGTAGNGTNRKIPHLGDAGMGVHRQSVSIVDWMNNLAERLRHVRVVCGDWTRVLGDTVTVKHGVTGIFFDPPYDAEGHDRSMYVAYGSVAKEVAEWCRENGENPLFRIALCGYEGEHTLPGWACVAWKARKGYGPDENSRRERIWFSPHCLSPGLFDFED